MALPVLTANSPAAGYISWTAFSIVYGGNEYKMAAGNSNSRYLWFKLVGSVAVLTNPAVTNSLQTSATMPTMTVDDRVIFRNVNGTGFNLLNTQVFDGSLAVTGSIIGDGIAANTITGVNIKASTIDARLIQANAILASAIGIESASDGISINGGFEEWAQPIDATTGQYSGQTQPVGWIRNYFTTGTAGALPATGLVKVSPGLFGTSSMQVSVAANQGEGTASRAIPVRQFQRYALEAYFQASTAGVGSVEFGVVFGTSDTFTAAQSVATSPSVQRAELYSIDSAGTGTALTNTAGVGGGYADLMQGFVPPQTGVAYRINGNFTVPVGATWMRVVCYTLNTASAYAIVWDQVIVQPLILSTYIGDGIIATRNLRADAIDGMVITGGTVRAGTYTGSGVSAVPANSKGRVEIDSTGIRGIYRDAAGADGLPTLEYITSSGALTIRGGTINGTNFSTNASSDLARVVMGPGTFSDTSTGGYTAKNPIRWYEDDVGGAVRMSMYTRRNGNTSVDAVWNGGFDGLGLSSIVQSPSSGKITMDVYDIGAVQGTHVFGAHGITSNKMRPTTSTTTGTYNVASAAGYQFPASFGQTVTFTGPASGQVIMLWDVGAITMSASTVTYANVTYELFNVTTNAVVYTPADDFALQIVYNANGQGGAKFNLRSGLTPGDSYRARVYVRGQGAGTVSVFRPSIAAIPVM